MTQPFNKPGLYRKRNADHECGFTLVEIAVAVAILGLALTTLVGLHTRMLDTYFNERSRLHAAFYAQYLMTMVEVAQDPPDTGVRKGDLVDELDKVGYFDSAVNTQRDEESKLAGWNFEQEVSSTDLPLLDDALRRVDLRISWGDGEDQQYSLVFFIGTQEEAAGGSPFGGGGFPGGGPTPTPTPGIFPRR